MKKTMALLLAVCMTFGQLTGNVLSVDADTFVSTEELEETTTESSEESETEGTDSEQRIVVSGMCGESLTWILDTEGNLIISGTGEMTSEGRDVWYGYSDNIKYVQINEGVTSICDEAFYNCSAIETADIADSVLSIGEDAFRRCSSLKELVIPKNIKTIGVYAFGDCKNLEKIYFNAESMDDFSSGDNNVFTSAGSNTDGLTVIFGKDVKSIPGCLFNSYFGFAEYTANISKVIFEEGCKCEYVGISAFNGCKTIEEVHIPDLEMWCGITFEFPTSNPLNYGHNLYMDGVRLSKVEIPYGIEKLNTYAFDGLSAETVILPDSLNTIGVSAFAKAEFKEITIPRGVKKLDDYAFQVCPNLEKVTFEGDVPSFGEEVFYDVTANMYYPGDNTTWQSTSKKTNHGGTLTWYSYTGEDKVGGNCGENLTWELSNENTLIISGNGTMNNYSNSSPAPWNNYAAQIKTIVIGEDVSSIGNYAFYNCTAVEKIIFNAVAMKDLIGSQTYAFYRCGVDGPGIKVIIDSNVTLVPGYLFASNVGADYVPNIKEVEFEDGSVCQTIGKFAFAYCNNMTISELPETISVIDDYAFYACKSIKEIKIPSGLEKIGSSAFLNADQLKAVYIDDLSAWCKIEFVNNTSNPLYYAHNLYLNGNVLTELIFPDGFTATGNYTFAGCNSLTKVVLPEGMTAIGQGVFAECSNLVDISIPEGFLDIGAEAFAACIALKEMELPDSLRSIAPGAFMYCIELTEISIPYSLQALGCAAFGGCSNLKHINIPATLLYIEPYAFIQTGLETISVEEGNSKYYEEDSVLFCYDDGTFYAEGLLLHTYPPIKSGDTYVIPDGVNMIGHHAFSYNQNLKSVEVPESVGAVFYGAFGESANLTDIYFRGDCPYFDADVFYNIPHITIHYPEGNETWLEFIASLEQNPNGNISFAGDAGNGPGSGSGEGEGSGEGGEGGEGTGEETATSGTCGDSVGWELGENGVLTIDAVEEAVTVSDEANVLNSNFNKNAGNWNTYQFDFFHKENVIRSGESNNTLNTEAKTVTKSYAMSDFASPEETPWYDIRDRIVGIVIGDGVTSIGSYAFADCDNLINITIGSGVTSVNEFAFADCASNMILSFSGNGPVIAENAFSNSSAEITYPGYDSTWESVVTEEYGGTITWKAHIPVTQIAKGWSGNTQWVLTSNGRLGIYGEGNMKNYGYECNQPWADYADQITEVVISEGVTSIGSGAFMNCTALKNVYLPENSLNKIGEAAFYGCSSLESIHIPDGIYTIWDYTFKNCTSLNNVRLPKTLLKLAQGAFEACTSLTYVFVPGETEIIGTWCFKGCSKLKEVDMQWADATEIRTGAFKNCGALDIIALPADIQVLGDSAFYGIGATSFIVPETVTEIAGWCFARSKLQDITFKGNAPTIGEGTFNKIEITAYYPSTNPTWTNEVMQNYGGTVTWKAN